MRPDVLLAIAGMALATYATRVAGLYLMRGVVVSGRLKTMLDALPPAILMAVIAPTILLGGNADFLDDLLAVRPAFLADRDHRRLVQHDALPADVDQRVGGAEVDGEVAGHQGLDSTSSSGDSAFICC